MAGTPTASTPNYDPDMPVYAEPEDLEHNTITIGEQKDIDSYIDPNKATVEGRVQGILANNSMLRNSVEADARVASNQRGILNTTMNQTAATKGLLDKAVEIATPDAALYGSMAVEQQQTDTDALLNQQVADLEFQQSKNNARISGALTTQELEGQAEIQKMADVAQLQRVEIDNQWKELMNLDQLDAQDAQNLLQTSAAIGAELTGGIERLLRDPNIENKTEAVEALMTQYKSQLSTAAAIVNINLEWS